MFTSFNSSTVSQRQRSSVCEELLPADETCGTELLFSNTDDDRGTEPGCPALQPQNKTEHIKTNDIILFITNSTFY
ncbi:MAG: hypothetical protein IJ362_05905 [Oscillospiraceae bacterium]|nr:hypothetical protein [Oscillospiraceae bacterium]